METAMQQPQMGLTFEKVWAALMELRDEQKKTGAKLRKTKETVNKMAAKVDRVSENVGGVNRSMGELIEILFAAKLLTGESVGLAERPAEFIPREW